MEEEIKFDTSLDVTNLKALTEHEVSALLSNLPKTKYNYNVELSKRIEELDIAKQDLNRTKAKAQLQASANKDKLDLKSDTDRKAWANNTPEVQEAELALLKAQGEKELARCRFEYLEDLFISVRKIASLIEKQNDAQDEYNNYA